MAKKKVEEKINLDSILFKCRDILRAARNSGSFFEKRDMMLTLVFLRFIGEKFEDGVKKLREDLIEQGLDPDDEEIFAAMTMSNFCSRIASTIVMKQKKENMYEYKVNMKMAIYLCKKFYRTKDADAKELMKDFAKYTEPIRQGRSDERNIKAKSFIGFTYRVSA